MDNFVTRQLKAYEMLRKKNINKALIGDPCSINYLTGINIIPYERFYGMVLDAESKTCTMINPSVDTGCMKGRVPEVVYLDSDGPKESIIKVVGDCDVLAVETTYFSMAIGNILNSLECKVVDIGDVIAKLRMYKDDYEIEQLQIAANIVDEAIAYVSDKIKPGMTEKELLLMLYSFMAKKPGVITDEFIILVQGGVNSADPHGVAGDYAFKEGDIVLLDFCAYYNYYWSDITRCLFVGSVGNPKLEEIYDIVLGANLAAIEMVKPGVKAKDIDKAARDYITNAGYGEFFLHRTGHGLGLSVHEEAYITSVNDLVLEEGMVFTIEPGIYLKGIGGVRIEDDILVTKDGHHIFTKSSKNLKDNIIKL
ncbi:MAG: aminopeptidase P family protein [Tissierellia bacterium]|nr:aminopeptidase P family protein [Tissierellia bacterium]MDD4781152.1 aminopeptidase P family protein [Tissierellia bacterium]